MDQNSAAGTPTKAADTFHADMEKAWVVPLWERQRGPENQRDFDEPPYHWHWQTLLPLFDAAYEAIKLDVAERRSLSLCNPSFPYNGRSWSATKTMNCALQLLMPGEHARPHRHSLNALRFGMEGTSATTIVNGKKCPMNPGDLIITPAWTWHEHVSDPAGDRSIWFNILDVPIHRFLGTRGFEPGPAHDIPAQFEDGAFAVGGLVPVADVPEQPHSPVFYYPWQAVVRALEAAPQAKDGSRTIRYVNPLTGEAVMPLLDCTLMGLSSRRDTTPYSSTSQSICLVVEGNGVSKVGDETFTWTRNDIFTLPQMTRISHRAETDGAKLFIVSDREVYRRLGLLKDEILS